MVLIAFWWDHVLLLFELMMLLLLVVVEWGVEIGPFAELNDVLDGHVARVRLHAQMTVVGEQHNLAEKANGVVSYWLFLNVCYFNNLMNINKNSNNNSLHLFDFGMNSRALSRQ